MVVSMVKPKWILLQWYVKCLFSGLHMTLECRDTKLWPVFGCITNVSTLKGRANKLVQTILDFVHKPRIDNYLGFQLFGNNNNNLSQASCTNQE